jgi:hypothetical protein
MQGIICFVIILGVAALFALLHKAVDRNHFEVYRNLTPIKKLQWQNKTVSTISSVLVVSIAIKTIIDTNEQ